LVEAVALNQGNANGQTPLDADEAAQLLPRHITTQGALDEWEQANILRAVQWAAKQRAPDVLTEHFCRDLHRRMFDRTWRWAGHFRQSDKNIGCTWTQVPTRLKQLLGNMSHQLREKVFSIEEAAARFHHQLVLVHPFPNGNGRHSRLMTDCLLKQHSVLPFSWGVRQHETAAGETRRRYIEALQAADAGDVAPLMAFVRG
jgi:Fic-DOC domain mobile mystery protein B